MRTRSAGHRWPRAVAARLAVARMAVARMAVVGVVAARVAVVGVLVTGVVLPMAPATAAAVRPYRMIDLGVEGLAADINDRGQVVGSLFTGDGERHPFLWQRGRVTDLGGLAPGPVQSGGAIEINNRGQVVGHSSVNPGMPMLHAFLWQRGTMTDLGTLGGWNSFAADVNERGVVIGWSETGALEESHGFLWRAGVMRGLPGVSIADINDRGQMVGFISGEAGGRTVLWDHGRVVDLPFWPRAMNNHGWIVGTGTVDGDEREHALLWRSGVVTDLGMLDPDFPDGYATPVDINDRGEVLGVSNVSKRDHVFLWRRGAMIDLASYGIPIDIAVSALNDRGDIVGTSQPAAGVLRAVLFRRS